MAKLKTGRHTGALKAQRQAEKRTSQNKGLMKQVRATTKKVLAAAKTKKATSIDKAAKKKTIHWKTAASKKSRLAKAVNKGAKAPAKKAAAKAK